MRRMTDLDRRKHWRVNSGRHFIDCNEDLKITGFKEVASDTVKEKSG